MNMRAIFYALLAASFYALHLPVSKRLLQAIDPTMMAALLYLGAGLGVALLTRVLPKSKTPAEALSRKDFPFLFGMIVLDIAAPILLMFGIYYGSPASASLLNNFEIVATTVIALLLFREAVSMRLWLAIALITLASLLLSFEGGERITFSMGSLFVLGATFCWGLENNCTRQLATKRTSTIVILKGIFSGLGALLIALFNGASVPQMGPMVTTLLLGCVAYGLSIFLYIRAQATLGAAKTSAYYAVAPFIGALLSFIFLNEILSWHFFVALIVMIAGATLVVIDTLITRHSHAHRHTFTHQHDGARHTHCIVHTHAHDHLFSHAVHTHRHRQAIFAEHLQQNTETCCD